MRQEGEYRARSVVVDGMRLHVRSSGSGRPLLLLHGLVGSWRNWRRNMSFLAKDANVFALDMANMGESERVSELDASMEATADRVARCMDALGIQQADVAGHSYGGAVAMMLAGRHPGRVRSLILCAPANPFCDLGEQLIRFYQTGLGKSFAKLVPLLPERLKGLALRRMYGDPSRVASDALEGYSRGLSVPGTIDHIIRILRLWSGDMTRLRVLIPSLEDTPTLLVWGDRDRAVGLQSGRELLCHLKNAELVVLPGVGHIAFEEKPELCNPLIREWLKTSPAGRSRVPGERSRPMATNTWTTTHPREAILGEQLAG